MAAVLALASISLALVGVAALVIAKRDALTRGQDAAGKGMYPGFLMLLLATPAFVLALVATILAATRWSDLGWATRVIGIVPLGIFTVLIVGSIAVESIIRERNATAAYQAMIAEPAGLIVDSDDARFLALYNALRPFIGDVELSCRPPAALYWQQREWLPRARVMFMNADELAAAPEGEDLMKDLRRAKPECPILLHYQDGEAGRTVAEQLEAAGWSVTPVEQAGEDWVEVRWLPLARQLMERELRRRPGLPPETI